MHWQLALWPFGPLARPLGSHCCLESIGSCSASPTMLLYSSSGKRLDWFLWNTDVGTLASLRIISSSACWNCGWDAAWSLHVLLHVEAPSSTPCIFEAPSGRHGSLSAALNSTHIDTAGASSFLTLLACLSLGNQCAGGRCQLQGPQPLLYNAGLLGYQQTMVTGDLAVAWQRL